VQADFVDAGGTRLFVRRWGKKGRPAVFYWHGGGGGSSEWPHLAPTLEAAGYSVYAPDAPGYGASAPIQPERYRASALAALAAALIDELGIAPVVMAGYSWGASIGFRVAARYPDRVRALALLDGGYALPEDDPSYDPSLDFEQLIEAWRVELEQQEDEDDAPIEIVAAAMAGSNIEPALPLLPELAATGMPVLLVAATEPAEWNEIRARRIEGFLSVIPNTQVVRVRAGHGILQDAGEEVRRALLDWLAENEL
jgi:pimeloyl-ACP methyl ester carboxylesterase